MSGKIDEDVYYTVSNQPRVETKVKGSRFIATVKNAPTKELAMTFLESVRSEYYDATHNCFAYRIGIEGLIYRSGDDGEPSGSAGKPILFAIQKAALSDVIVIVTRYFGGVKLGIGGLARAYSESAGKVLESAEKKPVYRTIPMKVYCTYEDLSLVKKVVEDISVNYEDIYSDAVEFRTDIPLSKIEVFKDLINSSTNGRAGVIMNS